MDKRNRQGWDNVMAKVKESASTDRGKKITRQSSRIHNVSKALRNVSDDAKTEAKLNRLNSLEADNYVEEHVEDDEEYVASEEEEEDDDDFDDDDDAGPSRRNSSKKKKQKVKETKSKSKKRRLSNSKSKIIGSDIVADFRTRPLMTWIYEETGQDLHSYHQMLEEMKQNQKERIGKKTGNEIYQSFYSNDRLQSISSLTSFRENSLLLSNLKDKK